MDDIAPIRWSKEVLSGKKASFCNCGAVFDVGYFKEQYNHSLAHSLAHEMMDVNPTRLKIKYIDYYYCG